MSYGIGPINSQQAYLPPEQDFPEDNNKLFREILSDRERRTANAINIKENGQYETRELITGQQWFNVNVSQNSRQPRYTFRKVINFGTLPNATTKSVAHGIPVNSNYIFTRIYGNANNGTFWIPLPYVNSASKNADIELFIDANYVNIVTGVDRTSYTQCYVILEFIKG